MGGALFRASSSQERPRGATAPPGCERALPTAIARRAGPLALGLLAFALTGCQQGLNMASAFDATRPALTIPYTGVREELRQYPDYGSIDASILVEEKAEPARAPSPKKGKP